MMRVDALGTRHPVADPATPPRIVSLVPSITELVCELGLSAYLVGRTGFCIHPAAMLQPVPKIGGTKDVNIEKIRRLQPTHLIVNIDENEKPAVDALAKFIPHIIVTHPLSPLDNPDLYRLLGSIFNATEAAEKLCTSFAAALATLPAPQTTERVLYCIWKDPWMTVSRDTYIAQMLALKGWQQWQAAGNQLRYPAFTWSAAMLNEIDRILLSSEPYRFDEQAVAALRAQTNKPVTLVDGEMLSWYGSRAIAGLSYLRELK